METVLFREKFSDWPDTSRLIKVKGQDTEIDKQGESIQDLQPCDAKRMIEIDTNPVTMKLEGSHVGRGSSWIERKDGIKREFEILTVNVVVWHVNEYEHFLLDEASHGQFHEGDTYVVRWHYMVSQKGLKNLKGEETKHSFTGRKRWAYFFWQGHKSSITEKGASALMTVELDEERGPQIRVVQGKEPPCFLNLFKGGAIVHQGRREGDEEEERMHTNNRLFLVRNEMATESYLLEVPCRCESLRSRASLVQLNLINGAAFVWHGAKSARHTRRRAVDCCQRFKDSPTPELGLHSKAKVVIKELEEGSESREFWDALGGRLRQSYCSLSKDPASFSFTPRLFHMSSVSGVFQFTEVVNPCRSHDLACPFPFLQSDLFKASQPGLFLVDVESVLYLWHGWWPAAKPGEDGRPENVKTGSAQSRFNVDRRCALKTVLDYAKEKKTKTSSCRVVFGGLEPLSFTNIFPFWTTEDEVKQIQLQEGRQDGVLLEAEEFLAKLSRTRYSLDELKLIPLPEGVDPLKLESYLSDDDFKKLLRVPRNEFDDLPKWKQRDLKKQSNLF